MTFVAAGLGVALVPRLAQGRVPDGVAVVALRGTPPARRVFAATRRGREAANTRRAGGVPRSATTATPSGTRSWARRGTSATPRPAATKVMRVEKSFVRCTRRGVKPAARPASVTSRHDVAGLGPTHVSSASASSAMRRRPGGGRRAAPRRGDQSSSGRRAKRGSPGARAGRLHRDGDVDRLLGQRGEAVRALDVEQLEAQPRLRGRERFGGRRGDRGQCGGEGADDDRAQLAAAVCRDVGLGALELGEERVGMGEQHVGGPREHEPAAPALCDRLAHLALERGELLGDGRGRQVQRLCRRRNVPWSARARRMRSRRTSIMQAILPIASRKLR